MIVAASAEAWASATARAAISGCRGFDPGLRSIRTIGDVLDFVEPLLTA